MLYVIAFWMWLRRGASFSVTVLLGARLVCGQLFAGNMFDLLGVQPAAGRLLSEADNQTPGAHPVVVISHGFWTRRFGAAPRNRRPDAATLLASQCA